MQSLDRPRRLLAFAIAALAGYVDAIGYLAAEGYFVSFMSGNTTRLATDFVRSPQLAFTPLLLVGGFVGGVALGRVLAAKTGRHRKPSVLGAVTLFLAGAYGARLAGSPTAALACMVLAMGALNNTFQRDENPVGLTYMTGALVRIGQGIADHVTGRRSTGWLLFLGLWIALAGGAICGAFAFVELGVVSLGFAVLGSAALCLGSFGISKR
ncbi:YoaK family protein [Novosphingobium aquimarinum]|uniref:YoaK family protein n=1 Tax=Novosphingobium aquimarinum TaxID=2682494 RepID=UPI0012EC5F94|nr:YoaK family protein [Novosphingobium aquimarinum]